MQDPSEPAPPASLPANVKLLGATSLFNDMASEMIYPLLPEFLLKVIGGTTFHLGVIEGVAETLSSLLKLWVGAWSDRAGQRKGFVVFGYSLATLIRPLIGLSTVWWQVLALRMTDRLGKGVRTAPRDALISESTPHHMQGRAFGFHRAMDHLGAAIGPLLATAFLLVFPGELRSLFLISLIPGAIVVALVAFGLRETIQQTQTATTSADSDKRIAAPLGWNFRLYLLAMVVFTLGNSSDAFLLVRARELGVAAAFLPLLWCAFHIVKSVGAGLAGPLADRLGARPMILVGWALYAIVYLAFAYAIQAWHAWSLFLIYGLFYALTEPAEKAYVTKLTSPEQKGFAFGAYHFATGISALPASVLFGWLYERFGPLASFGCGATLAAMAAILLTGIRTTSEGARD